MTAISERQSARFYICKNPKKCETFLYAKPQTFCKKQDNFRYVFIYKKQDTLRYAIFMKFLKLTFLYKKHDPLRYLTFYIQKVGHFAKSKTICVTFLNTKSGFFPLRDFSLHFWYWRRGGDFLYAKNNTLCVTFLYPKNYALCVTFLCTKSMTFSVTFLYPKNNALCVTFILYMYYCILLIPNYKRTYDQSDQIEE